MLLQPLLTLFDGAAILAILLGRIIQLGGVSLEAWKLVRGWRCTSGGRVQTVGTWSDIELLGNRDWMKERKADAYHRSK